MLVRFPIYRILTLRALRDQVERDVVLAQLGVNFFAVVEKIVYALRVDLNPSLFKKFTDGSFLQTLHPFHVTARQRELAVAVCLQARRQENLLVVNHDQTNSNAGILFLSHLLTSPR